MKKKHYKLYLFKIFIILLVISSFIVIVIFIFQQFIYEFSVIFTHNEFLLKKIKIFYFLLKKIFILISLVITLHFLFIPLKRLFKFISS